MSTTYRQCACGGRMASGAKRCRQCYFAQMGRGADSPHWKGGRLKARGYVRIYMPDHPRAHRGYVFEHIAVMESVLVRSLYAHENVHHINGVRSDNRPENLELWSKSQPAGQRVEDKIRWAQEILEQYGNHPLLAQS